MPRIRAALFLLLFTAGCHSWRTELVTPETLLANHPSRIRVTRTDGSRVSIDHAAIHADTIVGTLHASSYHQPVAISLSDVRDVATLRPNSLKTLVLVGTLVTLYYFIITFANARWD